MDTYSRPNGKPAYTERDVTGLLNAQGGRLYWYFWTMLGDDTAVTRALTATVIVALPDIGYRGLFATARTVCRQYPPVPAMPYARAEAPTLAAATRAALRRLTPADREICVLAAPAYPLNDADLGAVFDTWEVEDLLSRPMNAFTAALSACAADAGLEHDEDLVTRAWRLVGTGKVSLPYDEIVSLATDPTAEMLREGIRARFGATARAIRERQNGLEALGAGSKQTVSVQGMPEHMTVPLPRPGKADQDSGHRRVGAVAGTALMAGAIPVALAMAWAGHTTHSGQQASPPLSAVRAGAPASSGGSHAGADKSTVPPGKSGTYHGRHARAGSAAQQAAQSSAAGSSNAAATGTAASGFGSAATASAPTTTTTTTNAPPPTTTTTTTPPPTTTTTTTPPPTTTTTTTITTTGTGNGNGNGGVGNGNGNGNFNGNGNGGVGNVNGNNGNGNG